MDLFGNFGRFDTSIEWLKQYIIANDICDEKKMAVLLSIMGTEAYNLLCNLTAPIIPADSKACAKIVWILQSPQLTDTVWPQSFFTFTDMIKGRGGDTDTPKPQQVAGVKEINRALPARTKQDDAQRGLTRKQ